MERRGKGRKERGEQWREGRIEERRKRGWGNTNHLLTTHPQSSLTITPHTPPLLTHSQSSLTITPHTPPLLTSSILTHHHTSHSLHSSHILNPHTPSHLTLLTSPQLIEMPSLALSPVAPVRFSLSDPARSTKWNLALRVSQSSSAGRPDELPPPSSASEGT